MYTENMTTNETPAYIARDTYVGRYSIHRPNAKVRAATFTAAEIAAMAPEGVIWESYGATFPGRESFGRTRYVAAADGSLHCYDSDGAKKIIHPAGRNLRLLVK